MGSYREKTRSRSLDLQFERHREKGWSLSESDQNSRRSSSGSRRSLSRSRSRNHVASSEHKSFRRSSSVSSYLEKTQSRYLDLRSKRKNNRKPPPPAWTSDRWSSRLFGRLHKNIATMSEDNSKTILASAYVKPTILSMGKSYSPASTYMVC